MYIYSDSSPAKKVSQTRKNLSLLEKLSLCIKLAKNGECYSVPETIHRQCICSKTKKEPATKPAMKKEQLTKPSPPKRNRVNVCMLVYHGKRWGQQALYLMINVLAGLNGFLKHYLTSLQLTNLSTVCHDHKI